MSKRWRAVSNAVFDLTGPRFELQTSSFRNERVTAPTTRSLKIDLNFYCMKIYLLATYFILTLFWSRWYNKKPTLTQNSAYNAQLLKNETCFTRSEAASLKLFWELFINENFRLEQEDSVAFILVTGPNFKKATHFGTWLIKKSLQISTLQAIILA